MIEPLPSFEEFQKNPEAFRKWQQRRDNEFLWITTSILVIMILSLFWIVGIVLCGL